MWYGFPHCTSSLSSSLLLSPGERSPWITMLCGPIYWIQLHPLLSNHSFLKMLTFTAQMYPPSSKQSSLNFPLWPAEPACHFCSSHTGRLYAPPTSQGSTSPQRWTVASSTVVTPELSQSSRAQHIVCSCLTPFKPD